MNKDDQLMSEPNKVVDDVIDFDAKLSEKMVNVGEELAKNVGNDFHEPTVIKDFSINHINEFGQVDSNSLPEPTEERRGDYVTVKAVFENMEGIQDLKIVCSGKAWYAVPSTLDINYVLLAAKEVEEMQALGQQK